MRVPTKRNSASSLSRVSWGPTTSEARGGRLARADRRKVFHATECGDAVRDDPDPDKHKENLRLYRDLTEILVNGYIARHQHGARPRPAYGILPGRPSDACYYKCVSDVLAAFSNLTRETRKVAGRVEFGEAHINLHL